MGSNTDGKPLYQGVRSMNYKKSYFGCLIIVGWLGNGELASAAPRLFVSEGLNAVNAGDRIDHGPVVTGDLVSLALTLRNTGDETLVFDPASPVEVTNVAGDIQDIDVALAAGSIAPGGFGVLPIGFTANDEGELEVEITIRSNDPDNPDFVFVVAALGTRPVILVTDGVNVLAPGDTVDFGVTGPGQAIVRPLTIRNIGTGQLDFRGFSASSVLGGITDTDFPLARDPVNENESTDLTFLFTANSPGPKEIRVRIITNAIDNESFELFVTFKVLEEKIDAPRIQLFQENAPVNVNDDVDLGTVGVGSAREQTLQVANVGVLDLAITEIRVLDTSVGETDELAIDIEKQEIAPSESASLILRLTPLRFGDRRFLVTLRSTDPETPDYVFNVLFIATVDDQDTPVMQVTKDLDTINPGDTVILNDVAVGDSGGDAYVVRNIGAATLEITNILVTEFSLGNFSDFTASLSSTSIEPGDLAVLAVGFNPTAAGPREIELVLESNDPETPEYVINLEAFGIDADELIEGAPELTIVSRNETVDNGDTIDMGTVDAQQTVTETLVLRNTGTEALTLTRVTLAEQANGDENDFASQLGAATLAPGTETTMTITLSPTSRGERTAELTIESNDPDSPLVNMDVTATVIDDCNGNGQDDGFDLDDGVSEDCNENGTPDECESDADNDGFIDGCDECPGEDDTLDSDADGIVDCRDNCPGVANADQLDLDGNGVGEACSDLFQPQLQPGPVMCGATGAAMIPALMLGLCAMRSRRRMTQAID
jgi:hypothetical protein